MPLFCVSHPWRGLPEIKKSMSTDPASAGRPQPKRTPGQQGTRSPRISVEVPEGYLAVGRVVGVHGLRGEVKVELYTDFPERFAPGVVLALGDDLEEMEIEGVRPHKGNLLIAFAGVETREDAEALREEWLFVPEEEAAKLEENAFWVHDILGMAVFTETGEPLGSVTDVLFTGANEVYVVQLSAERAARAESAGWQTGGELLLPAIDQVVLAVDVAARRMTVRLMPGMLDA